MVRTILMTLLLSGCSWDSERHESRSDCELETPDGHIMRCNVHEDDKRQEGDLGPITK